MSNKEVELNQKRTTVEGIYYCPKCCISNIYIGDENYNNKIIKCPNCGIEVKLKKTVSLSFSSINWSSFKKFW